MPVILTGSLYDDLLTAADAAGATRVNARASWVRQNLVADTLRADSIRPPCKVAKLRCNPPPCVELWAVLDDALSADWEVAP